MSKSKRRFEVEKKIKQGKKILEAKGLGHLCTPKRLGRCRKVKALDCGKSNCICCHYDKIAGVKTRKHVRSDLDFQDMLDN